MPKKIRFYGVYYARMVNVPGRSTTAKEWGYEGTARGRNIQEVCSDLAEQSSMFRYFYDPNKLTFMENEIRLGPPLDI